MQVHGIREVEGEGWEGEREGVRRPLLIEERKKKVIMWKTNPRIRRLYFEVLLIKYMWSVLYN